ncbi:hypothetical protein [Paramicrobacterium agarici]|uniref:hypothetical protein n=1 Tax=Paramicrobacterium agarici TaxID=630514 RepID=UPI001151262F|nr:hypothetical protein [Microbacterium agarici]TQO23810.1 hypothetical protein FB385_2672 [Microbacterium agarici]
MTNEFRASNGWHIGEDGVLREANGRCVGYGGDVDRLREFFQELRDHELGRVRDVVNPNYVCYPGRDDSCVRIVSEASGDSWVFCRDDDFGGILVEQAAKRFFAAHPQHKPWHDAKPGEHWWLTVKGRAADYVAVRRHAPQGKSDVLLYPLYDLGAPMVGSDATGITAGELVRLVPEGGDDE